MGMARVLGYHYMLAKIGNNDNISNRGLLFLPAGSGLLVLGRKLNEVTNPYHAFPNIPGIVSA